METFITVKNFVTNPQFDKHRKSTLKKLNHKIIDKPILELIKQIKVLSYCFTIQSCFGHFLYLNQKDSGNTDPLPKTDIIKTVEYRIAYIAVCLQNNERGHKLFNEMKDIVKTDPANIQFGCADWFWQQQVNTFVLQVEPERYKTLDKVTLDYEESLKIEEVRNNFYNALNAIIKKIS